MAWRQWNHLVSLTQSKHPVRNDNNKWKLWGLLPPPPPPLQTKVVEKRRKKEEWMGDASLSLCLCECGLWIKHGIRKHFTNVLLLLHCQSVLLVVIAFSNYTPLSFFYIYLTWKICAPFAHPLFVGLLLFTHQRCGFAYRPHRRCAGSGCSVWWIIRGGAAQIRAIPNVCFCDLPEPGAEANESTVNQCIYPFPY